MTNKYDAEVLIKRFHFCHIYSHIYFRFMLHLSYLQLSRPHLSTLLLYCHLKASPHCCRQSKLPFFSLPDFSGLTAHLPQKAILINNLLTISNSSLISYIPHVEVINGRLNDLGSHPLFADGKRASTARPTALLKFISIYSLPPFIPALEQKAVTGFCCTSQVCGYKEIREYGRTDYGLRTYGS
jgi:hypothetical protein